jgi:hypothetical protein
VVDVAEQVKSQFGDDVAFILMEIYDDNEVDKGCAHRSRRLACRPSMAFRHQ